MEIAVIFASEVAVTRGVVIHVGGQVLSLLYSCLRMLCSFAGEQCKNRRFYRFGPPRGGDVAVVAALSRRWLHRLVSMRSRIALGLLPMQRRVALPWWWPEKRSLASSLSDGMCSGSTWCESGEALEVVSGQTAKRWQAYLISSCISAASMKSVNVYPSRVALRW